MMNKMPDMNTLKNLGKTVMYIIRMPWNGVVKNLHDDMRSGSANIMWKYPLAAGLAGYPFGFYYHESKTSLLENSILHLKTKTNHVRQKS
jgi:hypothetical protein